MRDLPRHTLRRTAAKTRVRVVEDDLRTAASLACLRRAGCQVAVAANGPDSLARAGASPHDLAIALASTGPVTIELPAAGGQP